jgi:hypothetical protein
MSIELTPPEGRSTPDTALVTLLTPSLKQALKVHRRLAGAELMAAIAMDVLDHLPHGVLVISTAGVVLATNRAADAILRARDGLALDHGEVLESHPGVRTVLHVFGGSSAVPPDGCQGRLRPVRRASSLPTKAG